MIAIALVWDVLLTPFVLPLVMGAFRRLQPRPGARMTRSVHDGAVR